MQKIEKIKQKPKWKISSFKDHLYNMKKIIKELEEQIAQMRKNKNKKKANNDKKSKINFYDI